MGRPRYLTDEQREESRKRQNQRRTLRTLARRTAARAARAIAEGREPGKAGQPRVLTDAERVEHRVDAIRKYRAGNLELIRARDAETKRAERAARAVAEGREPGHIGAAPKYTDEQRRALARKNSLSYWERNPDKRIQLARAYYEANREKFIAKVVVRRTRKAGNGGSFTPLDVARLMVVQRGICLFCAKPLGDAKPHIDHWIPVLMGGHSNPSNLALLHGRCNRIKGAKLPSSYGLPDDPALVRAALTPESPVPEGDPDGAL